MELMQVILALFCVLKFDVRLTTAKYNFKIEYEWSQLEFDFSSDKERQEAISNNTFKEGSVQPIDVQVYYPGSNGAEKMVFITSPRVSDGIPATLGIVTNKSRKGNGIIAPYPNWKWHTNPEMCKKHRMVSIYRVFIDECNRLWVLDNGVIGYKQICPPQLLAFDLKTNSVLRKYEIPFEQHYNTSDYITPVAESYAANCEDTFVYNADCKEKSLLVYDFKNNKSWRVFDKSFNPDPKYYIYNITGILLEIKDGILGLALSPPGHKRKLFYHALSSGTEHWVYTKYLKNEYLFSNSSNVPNIFYTYPKKRKMQSAVEAMDKSGNLYFSLLGDITIASWNIRSPYYDDTNFCIVGDNKRTMQFPSGMKVITDENGQKKLWIFATAYQRLASNTLHTNETNFIILSARVSIFCKAQKCCC